MDRKDESNVQVTQQSSQILSHAPLPVAR